MKKFEKLAGIYNDSANWPFRKHIDIPTITPHLGHLETLNILDYGCGTGFISRWLKDEGAKHIVGYDTSLNMLNYAKQRELKDNKGIIYTSSLGNYVESFDLVLAIYVLPYCSHVKNLLSVMQSMYRVLKPNGRLVALTLNPGFSKNNEYYRPYGFRLIEKEPRHDGSTIHFNICKPPYNETVQAYYYSLNTLETVCLEAGFSHIQYGDIIASPSEIINQFSAYLQCPHALLMTASKNT